MRYHLLWLACAAPLFLHAQRTTPVNGPHARAQRVVAFTGATVHVAPGEKLRDATVIIEGDRIRAVGTRVTLPRNAEVIDLKGAHIWPGLIEPYTSAGLPAMDRSSPRTTPGYWNRAVQATTDAAGLFNPEAEALAELRKQGYTTVVAHRADGIARGSGCAVSLAGNGLPEDLLSSRTAAHFSFRKGSSPDAYPNSLMGSIALLRQAFHDAQWATDARSADPQLEALQAQRGQLCVFEAEGREDVLRIHRLAKEFGLRTVVRTAGDEYMRLADVLATGQPLLIPLQLPELPDVADPLDALDVELGELKHWELAPTNAARIAEAKGRFAFTASGLKEPAAMWTALQRMLQQGLDTAAAVAALTTVPAELFGLADRVGALRPGMRADLLITSEHLFHPKNVVQETWAGGKRYVHEDRSRVDARGEYDLNLGGASIRLRLNGERAKPEAAVRPLGTDTTWTPATVKLDGALVTLDMPGARFGHAGPVRLNGMVHERGGLWDGQGQLPDGRWIAWSAIRQRGSAPKEKPQRKGLVLDSLWAAPTGEVWYPNNAYGRTLLPDTGTVILRNATIWTNGSNGILREADICLHKGKVFAVGKGLRKVDLFPRGNVEVLELDMRGKHITSGIIDEHAHIGISRGVNEGGQAISSEVRIGDVIDPDAVDLYRALAGGVTMVHQLHGSANPIGGQSSLIKLRYGRSSAQLPVAGAPPTIKFALGENVKQSNWGDRGRYPQSRMGVEQLMRDAFLRAGDYAKAMERYAQAKPKERATMEVPRRDLELDALVEILRGERHITCHSYVRSEILMLLGLADELGFRVNTFTHILEGYKVAPQLHAHGANASTFSDWWAYKAEVNDAIPYNAALMHDVGINVCINSDDAEMGRRLNQEAAKVVKYGGVPAEEAWKMVTLNPAKALHVDDRTGSLEVGKDADVVVWSSDPLAIAAVVEQVYVDGVLYHDRTRNAEQEAAAAAERARIIAKVLVARSAGEKVRSVRPPARRHYHCDTIGE